MEVPDQGNVWECSKESVLIGEKQKAGKSKAEIREINVISSRKNGVAVIVVLGVLALLMVMAVAFSVTMRVERAGAANYTSALNSRELAWAAMARAITDINIVCTNFFPGGDFLVSREGTPAWNTNGSSGVRLAAGRVRKYIPAPIYPTATNAVSGLVQQHAANAISEWRRLRTEEGMGGHIAYLVLNVSDLLDVSYVGGGAREGGTNAAEVVLPLNNSDLNELIQTRTGLTNGPLSVPYSDPRFESLAEFKVLTGMDLADIFIDYSRYLPDSNRTNAPLPLYIGGPVDSLRTNRTPVMLKFAATLQPSGENLNPIAAGEMFANLLDYVDADSMPVQLNAPNGESVPMLNEVAPVQTGLTVGNFLASIQIETWYPFTYPNRFESNFRVRCDYTAVVTVDTTNINSIVSNGWQSATTFPSSTNNPGRFKTFPVSINVPITPPITLTNHPSVEINISISNMVVLAGATSVVDSAANAVLKFTYEGNFTGPVEQPVLAPISYQVTDPRLNWRQTDWVTNSATIGSTNLPTLAYWAANPHLAKEYPIYVSDYGQLVSPLELGNLLIPSPSSGGQLAPWRTFRVFKQGVSYPRHHLLENFTIDADPTGTKRGLVNVNTPYPILLETAFRGMPHPYGRAGSPMLSDVDAKAIAKTIVATNAVDIRAGNAGFTNITSLLDLDWRAAAGMANKSDVEMEALAAYSTGLLGVRQNLFLIVASGSAAEEGMGVRGQDTVRIQSRKTAVALLWRDPVADAVTGRDKCFLRYFKWIDD